MQQLLKRKNKIVLKILKEKAKIVKCKLVKHKAVLKREVDLPFLKEPVWWYLQVGKDKYTIIYQGFKFNIRIVIFVNLKVRIEIKED